MFDYGVCFGGMLRGYASGYASRSVKTKVVAFPEGMLQGMLRGYASPKSNIPALHKLDTFKKDKPVSCPPSKLKHSNSGLLHLPPKHSTIARSGSVPGGELNPRGGGSLHVKFHVIHDSRGCEPLTC